MSLEPALREETRILKGCKICLITVKCQFQLNVGKNVKIRPDLEVCDSMNATFIDVQLPDLLSALLGTVPDISELPFFDSKTSAGVELIKKVRAELAQSPKISTSDDLIKIAQPITMDMSSLNPSFKSYFNEYVPAKVSLSLTIVVFIGSMILHLIMYLYHKCKVIRKYVPSVFKFGVDMPNVRPVMFIYPPTTPKQPNEIIQKHSDSHVFVMMSRIDGRLCPPYEDKDPNNPLLISQIHLKSDGNYHLKTSQNNINQNTPNNRQP